MGLIKKFDYFLTQEEKKLLKHYGRIRHRNNMTKFDPTTDNEDTLIYADSVLDALLLSKKNIVEEALNKTLFGTFSELRIYTMCSEFEYFKKPEPCEYTVRGTINMIGRSWPLYLAGEEINVREGQAVLYKGHDTHVFRKEFNGDYFIEFVLNYVDANGQYKEFLKDKKATFGES